MPTSVPRHGDRNSATSTITRAKSTVLICPKSTLLRAGSSTSTPNPARAAAMAQLRPPPGSRHSRRAAYTVHTAATPFTNQNDTSTTPADPKPTTLVTSNPKGG